MLLKLLPNLANNKIISILNKILMSPFYIAFVAILLTISSIFPVGFTFYYILICTSIVLPALLGRDMTALIPFGTILNIGISKELRKVNDKVFFGDSLPHFIIILSLVVMFAIGRLIFDLIIEKERRKQYPRFLIGYVAILLSFSLGGMFFPDHSINDFTFGLREFLALGGMYFYYFYTVDMKSIKKDYFAYLLFFFALAVSSQILIEAIRSGVDKPLEVGWANRSGLGGTLVACFSGVAYLIIKKHPGYTWIYTLLFLFFITMIGLTQCRGASLTSLVIAIPCLVLIFIFSKVATKITTGVLITIYIGVMTFLYFFQKDVFEECFGRLLISRTLSPIL